MQINTSLRVFAIVTALLLAGWWTAAAKAAGQDRSVLVVGDSLSAAYNIPREAGWVALLETRIEEQQIPYQVINASISGETTAGGLRRLPALLEDHQPDLVIIELGGNDGLRGFPPTLIRDNLESMVKLAKASGAEVLLAGIRIPPNYGKRYTEAFFANYEQLASEYEVALVPFFMEGVGGQPELMQADGVHPKAEGQPLLLENVWPHLRPMLVDGTRPKHTGDNAGLE